MTCGWSSRTIRSPNCSGGRGLVRASHCAARVVIEAALDPFDRDNLGGDAAIALDPQELGQAEEVQPAGEPRDLPVMAKRGVDETGGSDERT